MRGFWNVIIGLIVFLPTQVKCQTYISTKHYGELIDYMKDRKKRIESYISNQQVDSLQEVRSIFFITQGRHKPDTIPLLDNKERTWINFLLNDYNQVSADVDEHNHYFIEVEYDEPLFLEKVPSLTTMLLEFWMLLTERKIAEIERYVQDSEEAAFLRVYLKRMVNDIVGFPYADHYSLSEVNEEARQLVANMSQNNPRRDFLIWYVLYEFENTGDGTGVTIMPLGNSFFGSGLSNVFSNNYSFSLDAETSYNRWMFLGRMDFMRSQIMKDVQFENLLWQEGGDVFIETYTFSLGYSFVSNEFVRFTSLIGVGSTGLSYTSHNSGTTYEEEYFLQVNLGGALDFKLTPSYSSNLRIGQSHFSRSRKFFWYIRVYGGYTPNAFRNSFGTTGNASYLGVGFGVYKGEIVKKIDY